MPEFWNLRQNFEFNARIVKVKRKNFELKAKYWKCGKRSKLEFSNQRQKNKIWRFGILRSKTEFCDCGKSSWINFQILSLKTGFKDRSQEFWDESQSSVFEETSGHNQLKVHQRSLKPLGVCLYSDRLVSAVSLSTNSTVHHFILVVGKSLT